MADVDPLFVEPGAGHGIDWANLPARIVAPIGSVRAPPTGRRLGLAGAYDYWHPLGLGSAVPAAPLRSGRLSRRKSRRGKRQRRRAGDDRLANPVTYVPSRNAGPHRDRARVGPAATTTDSEIPRIEASRFANLTEYPRLRYRYLPEPSKARQPPNSGDRAGSPPRPVKGMIPGT